VRSAAVRAPDEPPPPLTFAKESRTHTIVDLGDDEDPLVDDIDPTFEELDDPDGLLRSGLVNGLVNGHRAELLDDEALDLLGDVDEEPSDVVADDRAGAAGRTAW
jgi:hypothetical protein